jgi:hypothetical protein
MIEEEVKDSLIMDKILPKNPIQSERNNQSPKLLIVNSSKQADDNEDSEDLAQHDPKLVKLR